MSDTRKPLSHASKSYMASTATGSSASPKCCVFSATSLADVKAPTFGMKTTSGVCGDLDHTKPPFLFSRIIHCLAGLIYCAVHTSRKDCADAWYMFIDMFMCRLFYFYIWVKTFGDHWPRVIQCRIVHRSCSQKPWNHICRCR